MELTVFRILRESDSETRQELVEFGSEVLDVLVLDAPMSLHVEVEFFVLSREEHHGYPLAPGVADFQIHIRPGTREIGDHESGRLAPGRLLQDAATLVADTEAARGQLQSLQGSRAQL